MFVVVVVVFFAAAATAIAVAAAWRLFYANDIVNSREKNKIDCSPNE